MCIIKAVAREFLSFFGSSMKMLHLFIIKYFLVLFHVFIQECSQGETGNGIREGDDVQRGGHRSDSNPEPAVARTHVIYR